MNPLLPAVEVNPKGKHKASVIWLHGLGADGNDFAPIIPELKLPEKMGVRFIFPHAPVRAVSLNAGFPMPAWFDIYGLSIKDRQDEPGIGESQAAIDALIAKEIASGIPSEKIVLAGFSQGAAMALHCGLCYPKPLAGIMVLSGFLLLADSLAARKHSANSHIPILMTHGKSDPILPIQFGEFSRDRLIELGHEVEWREYAMQHQVCEQEIKDMAAWLENVLSSN